MWKGGLSSLCRISVGSSKRHFPLWYTLRLSFKSNIPIFASHVLYVSVSYPFFSALNIRHANDQVSDRSKNAYLSFSKEHGRAVQTLHSMRKKENLSSHFDDVTLVHILDILNQPVTRLGEYILMLTPICPDLDETAKKNVASSVRSMESLLRKCRLNAITKIYAS